MKPLIRHIDIAEAQAHHAREILRREWLITNGLGGYGSGTICGMVSRRYHGLLVAALPAPFGRMVMLNHLAEHLRMPDGRCVQIGGDEPREPEDDTPHVHCIRDSASRMGYRSGPTKRRESSSKKCSCSSTGRTPSTSPTACSPARNPCTSRCGPRSTSARMNTMSAAHDPTAIRCGFTHGITKSPRPSCHIRCGSAWPRKARISSTKAAASASSPTIRNPSAATRRAACSGAPAASPRNQRALV